MRKVVTKHYIGSDKKEYKLVLMKRGKKACWSVNQGYGWQTISEPDCKLVEVEK